MTTKDEVQRLLEKLSPEQQHFAKAVSTMKIENATLQRQVSELKEVYDQLWKVVIVILDTQPEKTLRIHDSQFLRFKEEYRIDRTHDEKTHEVVLRLLTVFDKPIEN